MRSASLHLAETQRAARAIPRTKELLVVLLLRALLVTFLFAVGAGLGLVTSSPLWRSCGHPAVSAPSLLVLESFLACLRVLLRRLRLLCRHKLRDRLLAHGSRLGRSSHGADIVRKLALRPFRTVSITRKE